MKPKVLKAEIHQTSWVFQTSVKSTLNYVKTDRREKVLTR